MGTAFRDSTSTSDSQQLQGAGLTLDVIQDADTFRELQQEWTELLQNCPSNNLFVTWEWMYTWWTTLSGNRQLNLVTVRQNGLLIALAPLALVPSRFRRLMPFRTLEFIASGSVGSDYLSILIRNGHEEQALHELGSYLTNAQLMLELVRVDKSSFLMVNLALQLRQSGWDCVSLTTNYAPFTKLTGLTWTSYLASLYPSHSSDVTKKLKKLHKDHKVRLELAATEAERETAMEIFVRLHLERWAGDGGSVAMNEKELIRFHQGVSKLCLQQGWLRLFTLYLDDVAAASIYVFCYNNVYYYYQAAFNPQYSKYSVGMLILALGIKAAVEEGVDEYDFLHDDEEYKYLWAREERELIRLDLYPPQSVGKLYKQAVLMRGTLKRAFGNVLTKQKQAQ